MVLLSFTFHPQSHLTLHVLQVKKICFTLNEWIERGTHSITSGTAVILLSGVHFINSTVSSLSIKNISSVTFSGQLHGKTIIECNNGSRFGFKFYNVNGVYISNIQFKLCAVLYDHDDILADTISTIIIILIMPFNFALAFIKSQNIILNNVNTTNGGVLAAIDSKERSAFQIYNSILSCTSFVIQARCNLNIKKTSFQNITDNERYKLKINLALNVSFTDVTFQNNAAPLTIEYVEYTEFKGHVQFSWNSGDEVVIFINCVQMIIYPNATIEFSNNNVRNNLLHILNNHDRNADFNGYFIEGNETKVISFINNTVNNIGIMILESTITNFNSILLSKTQFIFKNNTCIEAKNRHAAVLFMVHASFNLEIVMLHLSITVLH